MSSDSQSNSLWLWWAGSPLFLQPVAHLSLTSMFSREPKGKMDRPDVPQTDKQRPACVHIKPGCFCWAYLTATLQLGANLSRLRPGRRNVDLPKQKKNSREWNFCQSQENHSKNPEGENCFQSRKFSCSSSFFSCSHQYFWVFPH